MPSGIYEHKEAKREYLTVFFNLEVRLDSKVISEEQLEKTIENLRKYSRKAAYDAGVRARMVHVIAEIGSVAPVPEKHPQSLV